MTKLRYMKGKEFVKKILKGERDFSGIRLEEGFNFNKYKYFEKMQKYLKGQDLMNVPVIIKDSEFRLVEANGLYLPYVNGEKTDFRKAYLWKANFMEANLGGADLRGANLVEANLGGADLRGVNFMEADLRGADLWGADLRIADLWGADLYGAYFGKANLKDVKNLSDAVDLGYAGFLETKVTEEEKWIIEEALKKKKLFVVE